VVGLHAVPSGQEPQSPLLQTEPLPQAVPFVMGLQVPVEQALQVPQAVWQQTPLPPPLAVTQFPFWHWLLPEQTLPSARVGLQVPAAQ
jgi:hypothetical protein